MHKLYIDDDSSVALAKWRLYNPGFVVAAPMYFQKFEAIFPDDNRKRAWDYRAYVEAKKDHIKFSLKDRQGVFGHLKVKRNFNDQDFYTQVFLKKQPASDEMRELLNPLIDEIVHDVFSANAFLTYGNVFEEKFLKLHSKNDGASKVIVFRELDGEVYAAEARGHKSPEGIFSVRGHFRRYQSGKVIWIDEYLKGIEKEK